MILLTVYYVYICYLKQKFIILYKLALVGDRRLLPLLNVKYDTVVVQKVFSRQPLLGVTVLYFLFLQ